MMKKSSSRSSVWWCKFHAPAIFGRKTSWKFASVILTRLEILNHRCAVYDPTQWRHFALHATQQFGNLVRIGDIDDKFVDRGAVLPQTLECRGCIGRGGLAAPEEGEMTGTLPDEPLSRRKAEPTAAAGDKIARRRATIAARFRRRSGAIAG